MRLAPLQFFIGLAAVCVCALSNASNVTAGELDLRLRVTWGGEQARVWKGSISISHGTLTQLVPLGLDADQPGSFIPRGDQILIVSKTAHRYDGLEVLASAVNTTDALHIELTPDGNAQQAKSFDIPLAELIREPRWESLDAEGNRLHIDRAPGDILRVRFARDALVFAPGERWPIEVLPHHADFKPGTSLRIKMRVRSVTKLRNEVVDAWSQNDDGYWFEEANVRVMDDGTIPPISGLDVRIPDTEGVYELAIEMAQRRGLKVPAYLLRSAHRRKVQFVVLDEQSRVSGGGISTVLTEFNPAEPSGLDRLTQLPQWKLLPLRSRGPWSNQQPASWSDDQSRAWTRLESEGWIAFSLPVGGTGRPHVLDVEFPPHLPQNVGISILEASATGELAPVGLDSGIMLGDQDLEFLDQASNQSPARHRIAFWPKTSSPILLITNRTPEKSVSFGRIRLEVFDGTLPSAAPSSQGTRHRLASLRRPLLTRNFLAPESTDKDKRYSIEDWKTFYESGRRLVEYLRYAGYDGAIIPVAGEGSALYPSRILEPTPKYDQGIFFDTGQDPRRKDVLALLLRMFSREGLVLVPSVEFATPLPALEFELANSTSAPGIVLENLHGQAWLNVNAAKKGQAPYYNLLDARVQNAMLGVLDELIDRYAGHPSFGGLQLSMHEHGFTHLPDIEWGLDRNTLAAFMQSQRAGQNKDLFETLQKQMDLRRQGAGLEATPVLHNWLSWRAKRTSDFYERLAGHVQTNSTGRLFLSTVALSNTIPWQRSLRPALPRRAHARDALLDQGLSENLMRSDSVVVLRPHVVASLANLAAQATNLEANRSAELDGLFGENAGASTQFYYPPEKLRLTSFDEMGPFDKAYTLLLTHFENSGFSARRPFVGSLASRDDLLMVDGGDMLVMGQEHELRPFFEVYRQLPNQRFATVKFEHAAPVTVRTTTVGYQTIVYFANNAPWQSSTTIEWEAPVSCQITSLGSHTLDGLRRDGKTSFGRISIEPYGLAALRFSSSNVVLRDCKTVAPLGISDLLARQYEQIASRKDRIEQPQPLKYLDDSGFELPLENGSSIGWTVRTVPTGSATIDVNTSSHGNSSLRLESTGGDVVATSNEFSPPKTGRLSLSIRVRTDHPEQPARLGLWLASNNGTYHPYYELSQNPLSKDFVEVQISANDVPADPSQRLRIVLALEGRGRVWVDEIRLYDKLFERGEQNELHKILQDAYTQHDAGDLGGCYETLSGYWPRFLLRHIDANQQRVALQPTPPVLPEPKPSFFDRLRTGGWF